MKKCIYCNENEANSSEHILQESLGSPWQEKGILCHTCNALFGRTIDKSVFDTFVFFINYLGICGKKKSVPPVEGITHDGKRFKRDGGNAEISFTADKTIELIENTNNYRKFSVTSSGSELKKLCETLAKTNEGFKVDTHFQGFVTHNIGAMHYKFSVTTATFFAMYKSCLNYAATCLPDSLSLLYESAKFVYSFAMSASTKSQKEIDYNEEFDIIKKYIKVEFNSALEIDIFKKNAHTLIAFTYQKKLYLGVILFNKIHFFYEISCNYNIDDFIKITSIDYVNRKYSSIQVDYKYFIENSRIKNVKKEQINEILMKQIEETIPLCLESDFKKNIEVLLLDGGICDFITLAKKQFIGLIEERIRELYKILAQNKEVKNFWDSDRGSIMIHTLSSGMDLEKAGLEISQEAYCRMMFCAFKTYPNIEELAIMSLRTS